MTELVEYLINIVSYVYSTLLINWGGEASTQYFDLAYAWILIILAIGFIFMFAMIPYLFKVLFSLFGRWGRS